MGYLSTWIGDLLSSRPVVGSIGVGISLCHQTFVNSSALLVFLMALSFRSGTEIPFGLANQLINVMIIPVLTW